MGTGAIVAVGGGKGGVGKSFVAANLAVALARAGMRTVLVDADLGGANAHTLFGIDRPGATLWALIEKDVAALDEVAVATGVPRLFLVPGAGAVIGAANLAHAQKQRLLRGIRALDAEIIVVDCGAGTSFNVLDAFLLSDVRLVVATPQLTSIQNAYAFLRAAVHRVLSELARAANDENARAAAVTRGSATERLPEVLSKIAAERPELAARARGVLATFEARLIGNAIDAPQGKHVLFALSRMMRDFIALDVPVAGALPMDPRAHQSVTRRRPFMLDHASSPAGQALTRIAESLLELDVHALRASREAAHEAQVPSAPGARVASERPGAAAPNLAPYTRREERVAVDLAVRFAGGHGRARDLSTHGALVELESGDAPPIGARIELEVSGERMSGVVRHARDRMFGVELEDASVPGARRLLAGASASSALHA